MWIKLNTELELTIQINRCMLESVIVDRIENSKIHFFRSIICRANGIGWKDKIVIIHSGLESKIDSW